MPYAQQVAQFRGGFNPTRRGYSIEKVLGPGYGIFTGMKLSDQCFVEAMPQHCLNISPLPQGQGSSLPMIGCCFW